MQNGEKNPEAIEAYKQGKLDLEKSFFLNENVSIKFLKLNFLIAVNTSWPTYWK